jgi:hypothetical protein
MSRSYTSSLPPGASIAGSGTALFYFFKNVWGSTSIPPIYFLGIMLRHKEMLLAAFRRGGDVSEGK